MSLSEKTIVDKIEVISLGSYKAINVRTARVIFDENGEIGRTFHRQVLMPNSDLSNENPEVVEVANQVFTDEVKTSYQIHVQSLKDH